MYVGYAERLICHRRVFASALGVLAALASSDAAVAQPQQNFYEYQAVAKDETHLSPEEQEQKNTQSLVAISGLIATHNGTIPIGFVPAPTWVGITAEIAQLAADNGLKFTRALLRAPGDRIRSPNAMDPAYAADGLCRFEFALPQATADFKNFLGIWPKLEYGPEDGSRVDRLYLPGDTAISFGELGVPEIAHANTDVLLSVFIAGDSDFVAGSDLPQIVSLGAGVHDVEWSATTLYSPIWDTAFPAVLIPVMALAEAKFGKYIDSFIEPKQALRADKLELISIKSNTDELAELIIKLNRRIRLLQILKQAAPELGDLTVDIVVDKMTSGQPSVSRRRIQQLTVYDLIPPTIELSSANPTFEATDLGGARTARYIEQLLATVVASDGCGRPFEIAHDAPEILPLGNTVVTWTVRDAGPVPLDADHDGDGEVDEDTFNSRSVTQVVTVEDTQWPILVPPPGLVFESAASIDLDEQALGRPLVVDLADLNPVVSSSTPNADGIVTPDTRTIVTWVATDNSGNSSPPAEQLVTVKTPGSNTAPIVVDRAADTLTSEPVAIVLTGQDSDVLPLTGTSGAAVFPDPLQFKIEQLPSHGEFVAPLYPYFIDDYRTDKVGGLIDYINSQPDADALMDSYIQAVVTNSLALWMNEEFCQAGVVAPVNFVFEPQFVQVTENGEQYFFDQYLVCNPNVDLDWATRPRISRWDRNNMFLGATRIDDGGAGSISDRDAVFRIGADGFLYFVDNTTGGEAGVLTIQRCSANLTNTTNNPPFCQNTSFFGPLDGDRTPGNGDPQNAYIDGDRGLVYVIKGRRVDVFDADDERFLGTLAEDSVDPPIQDFLNACGSFEATQFFDTMEVDSNGSFYVTDGRCDRIHKFEPSFVDDAGQFQRGGYVGWMGHCNGSNNLACDVPKARTKGYSCTTASACTIPIDPSTPTLDTGGPHIGQFQNPAFLAMDPNDVLYVADYDNDRIQRFGPDGTFAGQAQSTGDGVNAATNGSFVLGNMGPPKHVTVNSKNFFVVDQSENFVHIFDTSPFKDVTASSATVTYVSNFNFHSASDTFTYSVNDGLADSNIGTVSVTVARNYRQPLPTAQTVAVTEDAAKVIVLAGTDPDGILGRDFNGLDSLAFSVTRQPKHGTLVRGGDPGDVTLDPGMEVWTYIPDRDYHGADSFAFAVRDAYTDATIDTTTGTVIPDPYREAEPADVTIAVEPVNDIPIVRIRPRERVAAGFPYLLQADAYDDIGEGYAARAAWGDGTLDRDGAVVVDDNGTPNDTSDDSSTMTGIVYSAEGLAAIGRTQLTALHTYTTTGERTISLCLRDDAYLESCDDVEIDVESLVVLGTEVDVPATRVVDGVPFSATIGVVNSEPAGGVAGLPAADVRVAMELPAELRVLGVTPSQGSCAIVAHLLECSLGAMPNGASASIELALRGVGTLIYDATPQLMAEATTASASIADQSVSSVTVSLEAVTNDRDGDGLPNIFEAFYNISDAMADDDGDGLDNEAELEARTSPRSADSDGDGIDDGAETVYGTDATESDSDGDGLADFDELNVHGSDPLAEDSDGDGLPDQWEVDHGFDLLVDDGDGDADNDGLTDADEYGRGTDYLLADSDGDGLPDGNEVALHQTNPAAVDTDDDGLDDGAELAAGVDARKPDSDDDGLDDGAEVNVFATDPTRGDSDRDGLLDGWEVRDARNPLIPDYAVAAGGLSSCALTDAGVECWGRNDFGQAPATVPGLADPEQLTVGFVHACAIDRQGGTRTVECWGDNAFGQRTVPPLVAPLAVAAGGYHTCALDRRGPATTALVCWGRNHLGQVSTAPTSLTNPVRLVSGISGHSSCVLDDTSSGPELVCWGQHNNGNSSIPDGLTSLRDPLALGAEHGCIVDATQRTCWGLNADGQAPPGPTRTTAVDLALGGFHSCSLDEVARDRYTVACWGRNVDGQTSVPALAAPVDISAGSHHTCALDGGSAKCWGVETQFDLGQAPALRALNIDPDGDGASSSTEIAVGTNPLDPDTDRDGLADAAELALGTDPRGEDSDGDGVLDGGEVAVHGSNPRAEDSDDDGLPDGWEVEHGSDPAKNDALTDADTDGLPSSGELVRGTDPNAADTDGDGLEDGAELDVFRYEDTGQALGTATSEAVALGDLDGDGDLDAFVANRGSVHEIWLNDGSGAFTASTASTLNTFSALDVELFDVDFDGDLDAYLAHENPAVPNSLWVNEGAAVFSDAGATQLPPASSDGAAYGRVSPGPDETGMGIFVANWGENQAGTFFPPFDLQPGFVVDPLRGNSEDVALGDLDDDGFDDAFVVNRSQPNQVFRNVRQSPARFEQSQQLVPAAFSIAVDLADIDADGDLDAYEVVFNAGDRIWRNNGSGLFSNSGQSIGSGGGNDVSLVDIDADGYPEALIANTGAGRLRLNAQGTMTDSGVELGAGTSFGLAVGDLDGDGDPDVFYANDGPNTVWLLNQLEPAEPDTDGDGAFDGWELAHGFDPLDDADGGGDHDLDGLTNREEFDADSDPGLVDSDGDGMSDAFEAANGLDPTSDDSGLDREGDGLSNLGEYRQGGDPQADDVPPALTVPGDVIADSMGALTAVAIGTATAIDVRDGPVPAAVDNPGPYASGPHLLTWSASDFSGNRGEDTQNVGVTPRVDFAVDQSVDEGDTAVVGLTLNGPALSYPVVVEYSVSGQATNPEDHDAHAGVVVVDSGTEAEIEIGIVEDFVFEGPEAFTLTIASATNAVPGSQSTHTLTISQMNVKPTAEIIATQRGRVVTTAAADAGPITVAARVTDPNSGDTHSLDWSSSDSGMFDPTRFRVVSYNIDPATLNDGAYRLVLNVADDAVPMATNRVESLLRIVRTAPSLSATTDSDGDGVSDAAEGAADSDNDRVPDYLDAGNAANVLAYSDGSVLETQPGLGVRLGERAFGNGGGAELPEAALAEDIEHGFPNGIADFEITGVEPGARARIVMPLRHPLPANATYRKFTANRWQAFVVNDNDRVASAAGSQGACPAPGSPTYTSGMNRGDLCIELTIQDGGPNDADGLANGTISDPGGVAVPVGVSLEVAAAANRTVAAGSRGNPVLTLRLTSDSGDVALEALTLQASGSGDDREIDDVRVYVDENGNGAVDAADTNVATGSYGTDNGVLALRFTPPFPISAGQTHLLLSYDF